jgi:hypothetical protein
MNQKYAVSIAFVLPFLLVMGMTTGCCTKTTALSSRPDIDNKASNGRRQNSILAISRTRSSVREIEKIQNEFDTGNPKVDKARRRRAEQFKGLEFAHEMLLKSNPQGALREVERLQMNLRDDPYVEMQTWYLSAMIYHRLGKTSRRKRSMRKMLETMETLQKDPRFREIYKEGMETQDLIQKALTMEGNKHEE